MRTSGNGEGPIPQRPYTVLIGFFLACVCVGFVWCLWVVAGSERAAYEASGS